MSKKASAKRRRRRRRRCKAEKLAKHASLLASGQQAPLEPWYGKRNDQPSKKVGLPRELKRKTFPLFAKFEFSGFKDRSALRILRKCERLHQHLEKMIDVMVIHRLDWIYHEIKRVIYSLDFRPFLTVLERSCRKGSWLPSPFRQLLAKSSRLRPKRLLRELAP